MAFDASNNLHFTDDRDKTIHKLGSDGVIHTVTTIANSPYGIDFDGSGNLHISIFNTSSFWTIDRLSGSDLVRVAGNGNEGINGDGGPGVDAEFLGASHFAFDSAGNLLVGDCCQTIDFSTVGRRIRRIDAGGVINTIAGTTGSQGSTGDGGPAVDATFSGIFDVDVAANGNIFVGDSNSIRRIGTDGLINTIAGTPGGPLAIDGGLATAGAVPVSALTVDGDGNIFVSSTGHSIRKLTPVSALAPTATSLSPTSGAAGTQVTVTLNGSNFVTGATTITASNSGVTVGTVNVTSSSSLTVVLTLPPQSGTLDLRASVAAGTTGPATFTVTGGLSAPTLTSVSPNSGTPSSQVTVTLTGTDFVSGTTAVASPNTSVTIGSVNVASSTSLTAVLTLPATAGTFTISVTTPGGTSSTKTFSVAGVALTGSETFTISIAAGLKGVEEGGQALGQGLLPSGIAFDSSDNLFVASQGTNRVYQVTPAGVTTTFAGAGPRRFTGNGGPATSADLGAPGDVLLDGSGNVYISESTNHIVRRVTTDGNIEMFAGTGVQGSPIEGGQASAAPIGNPGALAIDASGNVYIADLFHRAVWKVRTDGVIERVAGNGISGNSGDGGPAVQATIRVPAGLALDASGRLYIADSSSHVIRRVASDGVITRVAGLSTSGFGGDGGQATAASFNFPSGIAVDASGVLYISDSGNHRIRRVRTDGVVETIAGTGVIGFLGDGGQATSALLFNPGKLALDGGGDIYVSDQGNRRIRRIDSRGVIDTFAGKPRRAFGGDGGPATEAQLSGPTGLETDEQGNLFIGDAGNRRVRRIDSDGIISTVIGTGVNGSDGDGGPATAAQLGSPGHVAVDARGNLYVSDRINDRIRKVTLDGIIQTIAGTVPRGFSGDGGQATAATLNFPYDMAFDGDGNLYFADHNNHRIRKIRTDGVIETVAGVGTHGFSGDGGQATLAHLSFPRDVVVDQQGTLYVADTENHRIRRIGTDGIITTVAGSATSGFSGDGAQATSARMSFPRGVVLDDAGNLYITDSGNRRIRRVNTSGVIETIAGNGSSDFDGKSGPATDGSIGTPEDIDIDIEGNLYFVDIGHSVVRKLTPDPAP
jgi:sugar lactone lactonase YvrE